MARKHADISVAFPVKKKLSAKAQAELPASRKLPKLIPVRPLTYRQRLDFTAKLLGPGILHLLPEAVLTPRKPHIPHKAYVNAHHGEVLCGGPVPASSIDPSDGPWNYWIHSDHPYQPLRVLFRTETEAKAVILTVAVATTYGDTPRLTLIDNSNSMQHVFDLKSGKPGFASTAILVKDGKWQAVTMYPQSGELYISAIYLDSAFS